jgi:hypothetical protein
MDADAVNQGMQVVMHCYEQDLKQPISNLMTGDLGRTLLIQVGPTSVARSKYSP